MSNVKFDRELRFDFSIPNNTTKTFRTFFVVCSYSSVTDRPLVGKTILDYLKFYSIRNRRK